MSVVGMMRAEFEPERLDPRKWLAHDIEQFELGQKAGQPLEGLRKPLVHRVRIRAFAAPRAIARFVEERLVPFVAALIDPIVVKELRLRTHHEDVRMASKKHANRGRGAFGRTDHQIIWLHNSLLRPLSTWPLPNWSQSPVSPRCAASSASGRRETNAWPFRRASPFRCHQYEY